MNDKVGIGANERKNDASEGIADIDPNRTLFVQQLTEEPDVIPTVVEDITNVNDAFNTFKPAVKVNFEDEEGAETEELIEFMKMGDFGPTGISKQSSYLKSLAGDIDSLHKILKQLKSNKVFQRLLENPEAKAAYMQILRDLIEELDDN